MQPTYNTAEGFANDVINEAKKGWVSGSYSVGGDVIGIKAHGKWVQRIVKNMEPYHEGEFKTQKAMREFITNFVRE